MVANLAGVVDQGLQQFPVLGGRSYWWRWWEANSINRFCPPSKCLRVGAHRLHRTRLGSQIGGQPLKCISHCYLP